jgi:uncharacterized protein involved in exopolysaccharide biosynthesis
MAQLHEASATTAMAHRGDPGVLAPLAEHKLALLGLPILLAAITYAATFLVSPRFVATTTLLPPQQQQSGTAAALASLGSLSALAGIGGAGKAPADQYIALMRSVSVSDRLIDKYQLLKEYDVNYKVDARRELAANVRINAGKKDGLITVDVEDTSPQRAADIANDYVEELRRMTSTLAVTEAQQRRAFFERQLLQSREQLTKSQTDLQASGFNAGALKAEPKAAAEGYAKLKAELVSAEVRLQVMRGRFVDNATEVQQQQGALQALRKQLALAEQPANSGQGPDYISKYREFKYHEALFEAYARQFELARVDESREGALVQVVDVAQPPEKKVKPARGKLTLGAAGGSFVLLALALILRGQRATTDDIQDDR